MKRPPISAEISRATLVESGHRCSVCGVPCPLERAHIVAWRKTRDNSLENLLCLCANCHERADKEKWGEKTLREYKVRPWVLRQNGTEVRAVTSTRVRIVIDKEYDGFDSYHENLVRHAIANLLEVTPGSVRIISKRRGSTVLEVELSVEDAGRLLELKHDLQRTLPLLPILDLTEVQGTYTGLVIFQNTPQTISSSRLTEALEALAAPVIWALGAGQEPATLPSQGSRDLKSPQKEELDTLYSSLEMAHLVQLIQQSLSARQRAIFALVIEGYRLVEISSLLAISRSLTSRELERIKATIQELRLPDAPRDEGKTHEPRDLSKLSRRELQVLKLIAIGTSYEEVGEILGLLTNTVRTYVAQIYKKLSLDVRDKEALAKTIESRPQNPGAPPDGWRRR